MMAETGGEWRALAGNGGNWRSCLHSDKIRRFPPFPAMDMDRQKYDKEERGPLRYHGMTLTSK